MFKLMLSGMLILLIWNAVTPSNLAGSTGCSNNWNPTRCWKYCKGNQGDWCYTSTGCKADKDCDHRSCAGTSCAEVESPGCVESCTVPSNKPNGMGYCKKDSSPSQCWQYCKEGSGSWCYTATGCQTNKECFHKWNCGSVSCSKVNATGCVDSCPVAGPVGNVTGNQQFPAETTTTTIALTTTKGDVCGTGWISGECLGHCGANEGGCWRYCKGTDGKWCFTGTDCKKDGDCPYTTTCGMVACSKAQSPGCVETCSAVSHRANGKVASSFVGCSILLTIFYLY